MSILRFVPHSFLALGLLLSAAGPAQSQTWQPLTHPAPFFASSPLLLTDGTVMVQQGNAWWKLTPDNLGSYVDGTWSKLAAMPDNYNPLYFASAVLPDGRVVVNGGEYNNGSQVETNMGAIYDPVANTWTALAGPAGWANIGDAQSVVLANGTYMLGNCCSSEAALLDATTLTWTVTGAGKADVDSEEGWTLLQDGTVLTVDVSNPHPDHSERYLPASGKWVSAGSTIVNLVNTSQFEIGPAMLRPDGTVFAAGATQFTSVYHPGVDGKTGTWVPGPDFPVIAGVGQLDSADGPSALLPDGNVLIATSPGVYFPPTYFFEFDGTNLNAEPATPNAPNIPSYAERLLVLPTGQVLSTDGSKQVEIYTSPGVPEAGWAPIIGSAPTTVTHGNTYPISGRQFNGLSQAVGYGDDYQAATNYPLVSITMQATGHVFFCRTHDHSTMSVAPKAKSATQFDVPANIELGAGDLVVIANGIPSKPVTVTIN